MSQSHTLSLREDRKTQMLVERLGFPFSHFGGDYRWLEEIASQTITSIGHLQGKHQGSNLEDTTHHLFQCLSISLWWGNSTMWLTRSPTPFFLLMVSYNNYKKIITMIMIIINNNNNNDCICGH